MESETRVRVKRSVAVLIRDDTAPDAVLLVQRPHDDDDLPGAWGLPAATLAGDETHAEAARRAGRDKLGLEIRIGRLLNEGSRQRAAYRLDMQLIEAWIVSGTPNVDLGTGRAAPDDEVRPDAGTDPATPGNAARPGTNAPEAQAGAQRGAADASDGVRPDPETPDRDAARPAVITRYQAWRWGRVPDLRPAAERGSLCSILALKVEPPV